MENSILGKSLFIGEQIEFTELDPEKDSKVLAEWSRQPAFSSRLFRGPFKPQSTAEVKKKLTDLLKEADESFQAIYFGIRKLNSPELIGLCWFGWIDASNQASMMNLLFGSDTDLRDQGHEAIKMVLHYAFMEMNLHRVAVTIRADEPQLLALYEGNSFLREVQRREAVFSQGQYLDEYLYALLKPEWLQKRKEIEK
jgi:RimJ/RimL family protein N-acetyltransferase